MKNLFAFALLALCSISVMATNPGEATPADGNDKINWITIQQLDSMAQSKSWDKNTKKVMIDVYTTWCGPCKMMMSRTFTDPTVIEYVNKNFIAVKFDAETDKEIMFGNQVYKFVPGTRRKGTNQLAYAIANVNGSLAYPTITFLDENMQKMNSERGFRGPEAMLPLLKKYAEKGK